MKTTKMTLNQKIFLLPLFLCLFMQFSSAQINNALGNNMVAVDSVQVGQSMEYTFAIYTGDMGTNPYPSGLGIQDGNIDSYDFNYWDFDNSIFNYGYLVTDLNGDANVDLYDFNFWDSNNAKFIYAVRPY